MSHIILKLFRFIVIVFILPILLRVFVFEIYKVPSSSMENTLISGDYIFVSKIHYGPRLPRNFMEIPIFNFFLSFVIPNETSYDLTRYQSSPFKRLKGFTNVKKNDVVVFNTPIFQSHISVKRCMKKTGDTLLVTRNKEFGMTEYICKPKLNRIIIPGKNMNGGDVQIFDIYSKKQVSPRKINNSYYYFQGDNLKFSTDSRSYGLVKDDHIIGKAVLILFSISEKGNANFGIRSERFFKKIS